MTALSSVPNGASGLDVRDTINALLKKSKGKIAPYLGLCSHNLLAPTQTVAGNSINGRVPDQTRTNISGTGRVRMPWYFVENTGWESGTGLSSATVALQIEYPVGVMTPVSFSASLTGTMTAGSSLWSDDFTWPDIPEGETFWWHPYVSTGGTNVVIVNRSSSSGAKFGGITFTNGQANQSANAAFVGSNPHIWYGPDLAVCMTNRRTFMVIGDSREQDLSGSQDINLDGGLVAYCLGSHFGLTTLAVNGAGIGASHSNPALRANTYAAAAYVSDVICCWGYNDKGTSTATLTTQFNTLYTGLKAVNSSVKTAQTTIYSGVTTTIANTGLSSSGTTATVSGLSQKAIDQLYVGETVYITGVTPSGYNATTVQGGAVITAISGTTFSYTLLLGASGLAASTVHGLTSDGGQSANPTVFQTPASGVSALPAINQDIRRGVRPLQDYYIEMADFFDWRRDALYVKPNMLIDGVHPNHFGKSAAKASGVVLNSIPGLMAA